MRFRIPAPSALSRHPKSKKTKTRMYVITLPLVIALTGCTTSNWQNPRIASAAQRDRQLVIDNGYCKRVAVGGAPMPNIQVANTQSQGYAVSGTTTSYGTYGQVTSNYRGTVTPMPNAGASFAGGVAQGAGLGAAMRAKRDQDEIHKSCMYSLGWSDL